MRNIFTLATIVCLILMSPVFAEDCKVVHPQFGTVSCECPAGTPYESLPTRSVCNGDICNFEFNCEGKSNCEILSEDIQIFCSSGWPTCVEYSIYVDGQLKEGEYHWGNCWGGEERKTNIEKFKRASIVARCSNYLDKMPVSSNSVISMKYQNIYLFDSNFDYPRHKVEESVGCVPNGIMYKSGYVGLLPRSWVDSSGAIAGSLNSSFVDTLPTNMKVPDTYSYFYGWREVSGINIVMSKHGDSIGYCGGSLGDRKLFQYSQISQGSGCYIVPTNILRNVECCYNEDCKWKDPSGSLVCDTSTFTCSDKKPCNSDIECQVLGQRQCLNRQETSWRCDFSQEWYPMKGTCVKEVKSVLCCSDGDCSSDEYCDKEQSCLKRYVLSDCQIGNCCKLGGDYKERNCGSGYVCCTIGGSYVGLCKVSCEEKPPSTSKETTATKNTVTNGVPSGTELQNSSKNQNPILLIAVIILILAIGAAIYLFRRINEREGGRTQTHSSHHQNISHSTHHIPISTHQPSAHKRFCTKCGAPLKEEVAFCTNCGKKI